MRQLDELRASGFDDPEGWYLYACCLARVGARAGALKLLAQAVDGGYALLRAADDRRPEWAPFRGIAFDALFERTGHGERERAKARCERRRAVPRRSASP